MTELPDKKLSAATIGCRLNQYETEKMAEDICARGFRRADKGEAADLYLINTCTVTHRADSSSRNIINRAVRENPNAKIVVAGCYVDSDREKIAQMIGVDVIIDNSEKPRIGEIVSDQLPELFEELSSRPGEVHFSDFHDQNRAWMKISDGCNQRCSFCILPRVRGRLVNRSPVDILREIDELIAAGFHEVVVTGVHIGHYRYRGYEPHIKNLASLCALILEKTKLSKLRLSSIEPQTIKSGLLELINNSDGRLCRYLHVPMQSGSSRILSLMRRPYDQEIYLERLAQIRRAVPDAIIGADVIVGFPGETDADFAESVKVAESGLVDYLHVFSYSDREGTAASEMTGKINSEVVKHRNSVLTAVSRKMWQLANERQVGRQLDVIAKAHSRNGQFYWGVADNYISVRLPESYPGGRKPVTVEIVRAESDHVVGQFLE